MRALSGSPIEEPVEGLPDLSSQANLRPVLGDDRGPRFVGSEPAPRARLGAGPCDLLLGFRDRTLGESRDCVAENAPTVFALGQEPDPAASAVFKTAKRLLDPR